MKKKEWQLHSVFALHANATTKICKRIMTRKEIKRKLTAGNTILFINEYEDFLSQVLRHFWESLGYRDFIALNQSFFFGEGISLSFQKDGYAGKIPLYMLLQEYAGQKHFRCAVLSLIVFRKKWQRLSLVFTPNFSNKSPILPEKILLCHGKNFLNL